MLGEDGLARCPEAVGGRDDLVSGFHPDGRNACVQGRRPRVHHEGVLGPDVAREILLQPDHFLLQGPPKDAALENGHYRVDVGLRDRRP